MSTTPSIPPPPDGSAIVAQQGAIPPPPDGSAIVAQSQPTGQSTSPSPDDKASNTRQMLVSGLTGMPTPNMTDADKASFARGKAAGAMSVPVVAGATIGATAAPEVIPSVVDKAKAVVKWSTANPIKTYAITQIADELGIHPFDLLHTTVKYGKSLFGDSDEGK